jgi:uncharacterized damage-inducible protein DinB
MTVTDYYDYLVRARHDLWAFLETMSDDALAKKVLPGPRFECIKDLISHIMAVEDSWIHEDILRDQPVWETVPELENAQDGAFYSAMLLEMLLKYWRAVEASTLKFLEALNPAELERLVTDSGSKGDELFTVEGVLWHVMQHEVRHTAQIALLARQLGFSPPQLDLIRYLRKSV